MLHVRCDRESNTVWTELIRPPLIGTKTVKSSHINVKVPTFNFQSPDPVVL